MAGLCEGGNEPSGSLKAILNPRFGYSEPKTITSPRKCNFKMAKMGFALQFLLLNHLITFLGCYSSSLLLKYRHTAYFRLSGLMTGTMDSFRFREVTKRPPALPRKYQFHYNEMLERQRIDISRRHEPPPISIIESQSWKGIANGVSNSQPLIQRYKKVVVIREDVQNVHLLLEYRPHIDVSLTCEHDPKLQKYCVCPQNMPQFDSEGIPNQAPETNKPMILNGPTSRNREDSDQVSVEVKQLGHLYLSIDKETFDPSTGEPYD
ncbi:hypothetical protein ANN_01382 [Periplaneta americana]|uniref:Uncharacterized protein n=1 Tax=Periplaneta americana TaxID=6978 RepID=A0ABQ8TWE8_PERAM|nr:hypothetical protein ANN_01382 [Periplaneta americana]